jgi:hypothetical protein
VILFVLRKDQDVVQVNKYKYIEHIPEDVINQPLEDRGGISQAEGHVQILIMTTRGVKGCIPIVSLSDAHKVVSVPEVELRKDSSSL